MENTLQLINDKGDVQVIFDSTVMSFHNCIFDPILCSDNVKSYKIISMETKRPVCFFTTSLKTKEVIK